MSLLIIGLVLFLGVHSIVIVAPTLRARTVQALGEGAWKGMYALVSLVGFVLICYGFGLARQAPVISYSPPAWLRHAAVILMLPVFTLVHGGIPAGTDQDRGQTPHVGRRETLGIRASARQRHVGGRVAVRRISSLGGGGPNLIEAPFDTPGNAYRAARTLERCHRGRAGARDLRAPDRMGTCAFVRRVAARKKKMLVRKPPPRKKSGRVE